MPPVFRAPSQDPRPQQGWWRVEASRFSHARGTSLIRNSTLSRFKAKAKVDEQFRL